MKRLLKIVALSLFAWVLFCIAFPNTAEGSDLRPGLEKATARAYCTPDTVEIGEPFTLFLDVVHEPQLRVMLDAPEDGIADNFGENWVLLKERQVLRLPLGDGSGRVLTQARWRLFALEPGEFQLPSVGADAVAPAAVQRIEPALARLQVRGELLEGEDQARDLLGFREPPTVAEGPLGTLLLWGIGLGLGLLLLLSVLFVRWIRRRGRSAQPEAGPDPLAQLASLDPTDDERVRELHYSLSKWTRLALDERHHTQRVGLSDEQWIAACREQGVLAPEIIERTEQLLATCAGVKYGAGQPTRWAATETWKEAQAICEEAAARSPETEEASP